MRRGSKGYTLIEVLITASIVAIVARIGFDFYIQYIMRANRALARTTLQTLAAKEEQQILQNPNSPAYTNDFYALIGAGTASPQTSFYIDQNNAISTSATGGSIYLISFASQSTSAYTLQAVAQGIQARRDTTCTTLLLSNTGLKQAKNSGGTAQSGANAATCWEK